MTHKYDLDAWHDHIKELLKRFLTADQPIVFLLTDGQVSFFKCFIS